MQDFQVVIERMKCIRQENMRSDQNDLINPEHTEVIVYRPVKRAVCACQEQKLRNISQSVLLEFPTFKRKTIHFY